MATILSTKTSGVGGLTVTGDASGVLELASANGTTAVTIDASQNVTTSANLTYTGTLTGSTGILNIGSGQVYKDASGNVGIGVTPSAWKSTLKVLEFANGVSLSGFASAPIMQLGTNWYDNGSSNIYKTTAAATSYQQSFGAHYWYTAPSGTAGNAVTFTQAMTLDASGNLLVGGSAVSSGARLMVKSTVNDWTTYFECTGASNPYGMFMKYTAASPNGTGNEFLDFRDSSTPRFQVRSNGGLANYSANNVNLSDERTKKDITNAGDYLAKICAIPVRTFLYKDQTDTDLNLGVIAQEVEAVAPELVDNSGFGETPEDGIPLKAIYQTDLQYALMKCIQEQQTLIEALTARLTALEAK